MGMLRFFCRVLWGCIGSVVQSNLIDFLFGNGDISLQTLNSSYYSHLVATHDPHHIATKLLV